MDGSNAPGPAAPKDGQATDRAAKDLKAKEAAAADLAPEELVSVEERVRILTGPAFPATSATLPAPVPIAPPDPLVGQTVDRYEIVRCIGRGAMGAVYEVRHSTLGKRRAMKLIHPELAQVPEFLSRFAQEARACSVLDHPNCIRVSDFGRTGIGQFFLVMEFVEGQSLTARLAEGVVELDEALEITRQILSGLAHAHAAGIVHRDIKPDNIMLTRGEDGRLLVKILDFGIAKMPVQAGGQLTQAGVIFGTPEYMAPEQVMTTQVDERADLYAVGTILWAMLVGREPFSAGGQVELLNLKLSKTAPVLQVMEPDRFPETLSRFLTRALEREPSARFASAEQMAETLELLDLVPGRKRTKQRNVVWRATTRAIGRFFFLFVRIWRWTRTQLGAWYDCDDDLTRLPSWSLRFKLLTSTRRGRGILLALIAIMAVAAVPILRPHVGGEREVSGWGGRITASLEKRLMMVRLFLGKNACREAAIDLKNLLREQPKLPVGHYLLGGAEFCRKRPIEGLAAYDRAIARRPEYSKDARIFEDVEALMQKGTAAERKAALAFANHHFELVGLRWLIKAASEDPMLPVRHAAIELVRRRGVAPNIEWVKSLSLDLAQLPTCAERKAVVEQLRKLGDTRAIPALVAAQEAEEGARNACARVGIKRALKLLRKKAKAENR